MICYMKCGGKVWIKIFFFKFYIVKLFEVCMGFGKGVLEGWVVVVKLGKVLFEIFGVFEEVVCEVFCFVFYKLLIKMKFVKCEEIGGELNES